MKLSELTTDQAADVLCEVTPYIANITGDKSLLDELGKKFDSTGKSVAELYTYKDLLDFFRSFGQGDGTA